MTNLEPTTSASPKDHMVQAPIQPKCCNKCGEKILKYGERKVQRGTPTKENIQQKSLKLSYSCMPNLASKISCRNKSVLEKAIQTTDKPCNCRAQSKCPFNGKCLTINVIYQATVESDNGNTETHIGLTGDTFKTRYSNHTASFRTETKRNATELSKHIWALQDRRLAYKLTWRIVARATPYPNTTK